MKVTRLSKRGDALQKRKVCPDGLDANVARDFQIFRFASILWEKKRLKRSQKTQPFHMARRGAFIVLEGLDRSGKSTQVLRGI